MQVELILRRPGMPERRRVFGLGVYYIGRAEDNAVILADIGVSRKHARLTVGENQVVIEDLGSGNGTTHEGSPIQRHRVEDGQEFLIDPFRVVFAFHGFESERKEEMTEEGSLASYAGPGRLGSGGGGSARLVVLAGQKLDSTYIIHDNRLTLGRTEERDVVLFDPAASREHAVIEWGSDRQWWLLDKGSANGTYVNSHRVGDQALRTGDRIRIGATEFRFEVLDAPVLELPASLLGDPEDAPPVSVRIEPEPIRHPDRDARRHVPDPPPRITERTSDKDTFNSTRVVVWSAFVVLSVGLGVTVGGVLIWFLLWMEPKLDFDIHQSGASEWFSQWGLMVDGQNQAEPAALADEKRTEIDDLLGKGRVLFGEGRYLDAAAQFYRVLKIDPYNHRAERLGFVACEAIAFQKLRDDVVLQTTSMKERRKKYREALMLADRAFAGKVQWAEARGALEQALVFYPQDSELTVVLAKVQQTSLRAENAQEIRLYREEASRLYAEADQHLEKGEYLKSIRSFEAVQTADPERSTHYWYDAADGVLEAKSRLKKELAPQFAKAKEDMKAGDHQQAQERLAEILAQDPYHDDAREALEQLEGDDQ